MWLALLSYHSSVFPKQPSLSIYHMKYWLFTVKLWNFIHYHPHLSHSPGPSHLKYTALGMLGTSQSANAKMASLVFWVAMLFINHIFWTKELIFKYVLEDRLNRLQGQSQMKKAWPCPVAQLKEQTGMKPINYHLQRWKWPKLWMANT